MWRVTAHTRVSSNAEGVSLAWEAWYTREVTGGEPETRPREQPRESLPAPPCLALAWVCGRRECLNSTGWFSYNLVKGPF